MTISMHRNDNDNTSWGRVSGFNGGRYHQVTLNVDEDEHPWAADGMEIGRCVCCALPLAVDADAICEGCAEMSRIDDDWDDWLDLGAPD